MRCESRSQDKNLDMLTQHAQFLRDMSAQKISIWGPIPAPMERKAGRFHAHMVLLATERSQLHLQLGVWWPNLLQQKPAQMKLSLDIDPQELS